MSFAHLFISIAPTGICCDNCLRKTSPDHPLLLALTRQELEEPSERPPSPSSDDEDSPSQTPDANGKRPMREAPAAPNRCESHPKQAHDILTRWRDEKCATVYRRRPWGPQVLLPDDTLTKFATWARLKTVSDLVDHSDWRVLLMQQSTGPKFWPFLPSSMSARSSNASRATRSGQTKGKRPLRNGNGWRRREKCWRVLVSRH